MELSTIWWILVGICIVVELATGTFYLFMISFGLATGAITAHLGLDLYIQLLATSIVSLVSVGVWHFFGILRSKNKAEESQDVHIDIGSTVKVTSWTSIGTTSVKHRGAQWSARHIHSGTENNTNFQSGYYQIAAIEGSTLILTPHQPINNK